MLAIAVCYYQTSCMHLSLGSQMMAKSKLKKSLKDATQAIALLGMLLTV